MTFRLIFLLLTGFILISCVDDQPEFTQPELSILETRKLSNHSGIIVYKVNKGYGAKLKELTVSLQNITNDNTETIAKSLVMKDSTEFTDSVLIDHLLYKNDYRVQFNLISEKNTYKSKPSILNLSSKFDDIYTGVLGFDVTVSDHHNHYIEEYNGFKIKPLAKNAGFQVNIFFRDSFNPGNKYEFRLNDSILLTSNLQFELQQNQASCEVNISNEVPAGEYSLVLYVNNQKFAAKSKVRVMPGSQIVSSMPLIPITNHSSWSITDFLLNDNIYIIYKNLVARYNIGNNSWVRLNDIEPNIANSSYFVQDASFQHNNSQYIFAYNSFQYTGKIDLLKYIENEDKWINVSSHPDTNEEPFVFKIDDNIFVGIKKLFNRRFWKYSITSNQWTRLNDIPEAFTGAVTGTCYDENSGFMMNEFRELWQYQPSSDSWRKITTLYAGPNSRIKTALRYNNGFVYLIGGYSTISGFGSELADIRRYNIQENVWECVYILKQTNNWNFHKFVYGNRIILIPNENYRISSKVEVNF